MRPASSLVASMTVAALLTGPAAAADSMTIQNDSGAGQVTCPCFVQGEQVAAWLTSPCDGAITNVQIGWGSPFGGQPDSLEQEVHIFRGGFFPSPGPEMTNGELLGPVMVDGFIADFNTAFIADNMVTAGETFVVSLELLNASVPPFGPGPVHDGDGCQPAKNAVLAIPGGWINACPAGVTGDWVIRAVVKCTGVMTCPGDVDLSGDVGFSDILQIIASWGPCGVPCPEDLSGNGQVDFADILIAIAQWGPC